jgi:hypothetical protein
MLYIDIDANTAVQQINQANPWNLAAISGGRAYRQAVLTEDACADALVLPVGSGYRVRVLYAADDTYTVQRVFERSGKVTVKGEQTDVYCDELGEVAYQASCFRSNDFGAHKV